MGFNTFEFLVFLPLVFTLYWLVFKNRKKQNLLLLIASYVFYGMWDWRFLILIVISSAVDFYVGKHIPRNRGTVKAKYLLWLSLAVNLGLLGFFKYFNFFVGSFIALFQSVGIHLSPVTTQIIVPVGISFYTFQTLSYTIDIYRNRIKPTDDWLTFFAFVSFFPQLVAGPIERASFLIPQFEKSRIFQLSQAKEGLRFILYGLFKKVVVADFCGFYADEIFNNYQELGGADLFLGAYFFFGGQLYADFSAYSEIAIGAAMLLGFKLSRNFAYPYFSKNIEELWQRWHITLSQWFRDYVLLISLRSPLRKLGVSTMVFVMFTLIGLWHGPNYTYIAWGMAHGLMFLGYQRLKRTGFVKPEFRRSEISDLGSMVALNFMVGLVVIFFRSPSLSFSFEYIGLMFGGFFEEWPRYLDKMYWPIFVLIWEWQFRDHWHGLAVAHWPVWKRWLTYLVFALATMYCFGHQREFIYFQF